MCVFDKMSDVNMFVALIEEILSSTADRTVDPMSLKMAVLSNMYAQWNTKAQNESE
jgi:hypothetical protein